MFQMLTFLLEIQCSMSLCYVLITSVTWCKLWLNSDWESQALRHKEYWVLSAVVCKVLGAGAVFSSAFVCLVLFKPISCAGGGLLHLAGSEKWVSANSTPSMYSWVVRQSVRAVVNVHPSEQTFPVHALIHLYYAVWISQLGHTARVCSWSSQHHDG